MLAVTSLKISTDALINQTGDILRFLDRNFAQLITYPTIVEADIEYASFCSQYEAIKEYITSIPAGLGNEMIRDKGKDLPQLNKEDFQYNTVGLPGYLLFILLPIGIIVWINNYFKLSSLQNKLRAIEGSLNTISFLAKGAAN